ncbi:MAG: hypothetical protein U1D55_02690 [Phycisphaerae bacterium]
MPRAAEVLKLTAPPARKAIELLVSLRVLRETTGSSVTEYMPITSTSVFSRATRPDHAEAAASSERRSVFRPASFSQRCTVTSRYNGSNVAQQRLDLGQVGQCHSGNRVQRQQNPLLGAHTMLVLGHSFNGRPFKFRARWKLLFGTRQVW